MFLSRFGVRKVIEMFFFFSEWVICVDRGEEVFGDVMFLRRNLDRNLVCYSLFVSACVFFFLHRFSSSAFFFFFYPSNAYQRRQSNNSIIFMSFNWDVVVVVVVAVGSVLFLRDMLLCCVFFSVLFFYICLSPSLPLSLDISLRFFCLCMRFSAYCLMHGHYLLWCPILSFRSFYFSSISSLFLFLNRMVCITYIYIHTSIHPYIHPDTASYDHTHTSPQPSSYIHHHIHISFLPSFLRFVSPLLYFFYFFYCFFLFYLFFFSRFQTSN